MEQPAVRVGQVWQEVDPRTDRRVIVLNVYMSRALIRNVNFHSGRGRLAKLSRFNGRRGGYRLVKDVSDARESS